MKFVFLSGGFAGFITAGAASYYAGHQADRVLFDAAVGCLAGSMLFRWFWTILVRGIRETILARQAAAVPAAAKSK
ncbi:hypothetical protein [Horticoccus sp. 23ND18S-11]|uniref:hypothetical protein n=1 Tax=Horticoccus sp. 23ND18S-11 TaxID=3391832 RepID=UPI0039C9B216